MKHTSLNNPWVVVTLLLLLFGGVPLFNYLNPTHEVEENVLAGKVTSIKLNVVSGGEGPSTGYVLYSLTDEQGVNHEFGLKKSGELLQVKQGEFVTVKFTYKKLATGGKELVETKVIKQ